MLFNSDANLVMTVPFPIALNRGVSQKGGTTNLRSNLLLHPMVWGVWTEVHFFDRSPSG